MNKIYRSLVAIGATSIFIFLIWFFSDIVAYILISFVLAMLGKPLVDFLNRIHISKFTIPKWVAATITLIVLWLVAIASFYVFLPIIIEKSSILASADLSPMLDAFREPLTKLEVALQELFPSNTTQLSLNELINSKLSSLFNFNFVNHLFSSLTEVASKLVVALFSISFITFFFLKDDTLFYDGVILLFPKRYEQNITRALNSIKVLMMRYFIGLFVESLIKLIFITVGMMILGIDMEDALMIGLISAILNVIPYVGPIIGAAIGLFIGSISTAVGADPALMWQMLIVFTLFQFLDNIILQPYIYSSSVKAHPLEIFLVILIAGGIAGILGMLLAIPAYTILRILAKEFFNNFRLVQKLTENI